MPQTLLIFDFGPNEEAAQQARHRLEGWRQAFRLGDRLKFKFERQAAQPDSVPSDDQPAKPKKGRATKGKKAASKAEKPKETKETKKAASDRLRLMVRLEFSNHEKLSYRSWLGRLGAEPPFQGTEKRVFERGQEGFDAAAETFDSLP